MGQGAEVEDEEERMKIEFVPTKHSKPYVDQLSPGHVFRVDGLTAVRTRDGYMYLTGRSQSFQCFQIAQGYNPTVDEVLGTLEITP